MEALRHYLALSGGAGMVIAADQWSKFWVRMRLAPGETWTPWPWLERYARIVHTDNTGAAFGIFPDGGLIFTIVAILVTLAIIYYFPRVPGHQRQVRLALILQLGGAIGNLLDRILQGGRVTDFVSVGRFPVFNVADASISIGVAILVVSMLLEERRIKSVEKLETQSAAGDSAPEAEHGSG